MTKPSRSTPDNKILPDKVRQTGTWLDRRFGMNRFLRRFLFFILILILLSVSLAGYAARYPLSFSIPSPVLTFERSGDVQYIVQLKSNEFTDERIAGMDQVYLHDFTHAIRADFSYAYQGSHSAIVDYNYKIDAIINVYDLEDPGTLLLSRTINLVPQTVRRLESDRVLIADSVMINLEEYESLAKDFFSVSDQEALFDLDVTMDIEIKPYLTGGWHVIQDQLALNIPLVQEKFELTRTSTQSQPSRVFQPVVYQLVLAQIPWLVYPIMAGIALLLIILLSLTTRSIRKGKFWPKLRKMLKMASGQVMVIGDKAWEPEWCITVTEFKSLLKTARKLKHPIFCYVDRQEPAAYFYIYYGENNYCYTFTDPNSLPATADADLDLPAPFERAANPLNVFEPVEPEPATEEPVDQPAPQNPPPVDERIPLLPETDDLDDILPPSDDNGDIRNLF